MEPPADLPDGVASNKREKRHLILHEPPSLDRPMGDPVRMAPWALIRGTAAPGWRIVLWLGLQAQIWGVWPQKPPQHDQALSSGRGFPKIQINTHNDVWSIRPDLLHPGWDQPTRVIHAMMV